MKAETQPVESVPAAEISESDTGKYTSLPLGHYITVDVFRSEQNAINRRDQLNREGVEAKIRKVRDDDRFYVTLRDFKTLNEAIAAAKQMQQQPVFRDVWVLIIHR